MSSSLLMPFTVVSTSGCDCMYHMISHDVGMYGNEDGSIPATFEILNLIGWKPHASQVCMLKLSARIISYSACVAKLLVVCTL